MSVHDANRKDLIITDCLTNDIFTLHDFYKFGHYTQGSMIEDIVLPLLYDNHNVQLSNGFRE